MPARCITTAMPGAARVAMTGTAAATASSRTSTGREMTIDGEDISTTGSSVWAGIVHSETTRAPATGAMIAGSSSGAQNATATNRRSDVEGHRLSTIPAIPGRATISIATVGTRM